MAKKILLADDSLTIHRVVELTFAEEDFELYTARNGQEALAKIDEVNPDLIITDVNMPEMDGYDLCREVKEDPALSHIPVILLKGTFEPFDEEKAKSVRYDAIISKPFQSKNFVAKVKEVLSALEPKVEPSPAPAIEAPLEELESEKGMPIAAPEEMGEEQVKEEKVEEELKIGEEKELEEALYRLEEPPLEEEELLQLLEEEEEEVSKLAPESERAEMLAESLEERPAPPEGIEPREVKTEEPEEVEIEKPEAPLVEETKEEVEAPLMEEEVAIPGEEPEEVEAEKPEAPLVEETKGEAEVPLMEEEIAFPGEEPEELEVPTEEEPTPPVEEPAREAKPIALSEEEIETVVRRVVEQMSDEVIREVAWEVIPELAEELIKRAIEEIKGE